MPTFTRARFVLNSLALLSLLNSVNPPQTFADDNRPARPVEESTPEETSQISRPNGRTIERLDTLFAPPSASAKSGQAVSIPGLASSPVVSQEDAAVQEALELAYDAGSDLSGAAASLANDVLGGVARLGKKAPPSENIVVGTDNRTQVTNTQTTPFKSICRLEVTWSNGAKSSGSGCLVGKRVVMTSAHVIYNSSRGGWASTVRVVPGKNGSSEPYGAATHLTLYAPESYTKSADAAGDIGWVILRDQTLWNRVGYHFGYGTLSDSTMKTVNLNSAGYAGDKPTATMWREYNTKDQLLVGTGMITHYFDSYDGSSGMPLYEASSSSRYVRSVHKGGSSDNVSNRGVRITSTWKTWTDDFKKQYP